jgi:hypothetical protein
MGVGDDAEFMAGLSEASSELERATVPSGGDVRLVKDMSLSAFRQRLIEHFDISWRQGEVQWPSRTGVVEWAAL